MRSLHEWFERTAAQHPERIAVKHAGRAWTYDELNQRANQLAHALRRRGVGPEVLVGLWTDRSLETILGILGILKSGGAYLPLDAKYPRERTQFILDDAGVQILLTTRGVDLGEVGSGRDVLHIDEGEAVFRGAPRENPAAPTADSGAAYVIYTSGSTGEPKGVVVEHRQALRLFTETERWYGFSADDVWTQYHSHAFDFSVWEVWGALLYGGRLIIVPHATSRSFDELRRLIADEGVTVLCQTPTAFRHLIEADARAPRAQRLGLRYIIFGGERLDFAMLRPWFARHGEETTLVNMYGITETTVHATFRVVRPADLDRPSLIGRPIPDLRIHLLDEQRRPVRPGEIGEIYVEGPGVARGYLKRPDLTAERFLESPFGRPGRFYKSGDLARHSVDGDLEYIGRADLQVQLRGFRVELGEIEAALLQLPQVRAAAVVVRDERGADPKLVAFVVADAGASIDDRELRRRLRQRLPDYMTPNRVIQVPSLPLTAVGKLDRRALQALADGGGAAAAAPPVEPPRHERALVCIVAEELELASAGAEDDIFDLGATSLTVTSIVERARVELGLAVPVQLWLEEATVSGVLRALRAERSASPAAEDRGEPSAEHRDGMGRAAALYAALREILAEELELAEVPEDADLFDLGATSLTVANAVAALRDRMAYELGVDVLLERPTLRELRGYLTAAAPGPAQSNAPSLETPPAPRPSPGPVPVERLATQLAVFRGRSIDGRTRYLYASAGGKYAGQVYVEVRPRGVAGVPAGVYWYDAEAHQLIAVSPGAAVEAAAHHPVDREAHARAPFCLHLIADLDVLRPTYQGFSESFAHLDAGYMEQLVRRTGAELQLAYRSALALDFERLRPLFRLPDAHRFASCLIADSSGVGERAPEPEERPSADHYLERPRFFTKADLDALYQRLRNQGPGRTESPDADKVGTQRGERPPGEALPLPPVAIEEAGYRARFCQREYETGPVPQSTLLALLAGAAPADGRAAAPRDVLVFVHCKPGGVDGLAAGMYRYDPDLGALHFVLPLEADALRRCHAPFNRKHFEAAAYSLFFIADVGAIEARRGPQALQELLRSAGSIGQRLLEEQARYEVGLVPIGGFGFDDLRARLGLGEGGVLLHGMVGGRRRQAAPAEAAAPAPRPAPLAGEEPPRGQRLDVAITGMSGRYPRAGSVEELWERLRGGERCITRAAEARPALGLGADGKERWGGFIEGIEGFDSEFFGVAPAEADTLEPEARLMLEAAWEALEDAACSPSCLRQQGLTVGVFLGCMYDHYHLLADDPRLRDLLLLQSYSGIVNRVSYHLDLRGPSVAVDAACASSAIAIHQAAISLWLGECDVAIVGGVNLTLHGGKYAGLESLGLLASRGDRAAFSASDGIVPGEGVGALVLKRSERAERDGDRIYAVIDGTAIGHNGRTRSFNMPSAEAQQQVMARALRRAGAAPRQLSYVESSATGSPLGDPVELAALCRLRQGEEAGGRCALGSIKGNIGHLEAAAGISQVTKVALQLHHRLLVPTIGSTPRSPAVRLESTPFCLQEEAAPWARPPGEDGPRRALVNSFAAGGSNACLVLREHEAPARAEPAPGRCYALTLSARSERALRAQAERLAAALERQQDLPLADVAYTLARREVMGHRLVVLASQAREASERLRAFAAGKGGEAGMCTGVEEGPGGLAGVLNEDEGARALVASWLRSGRLDRVARLWVQGVRIDWTGAADAGRVVTLPTYPFERRPHWLVSVSPAGHVEEGTRARTPAAPRADTPASALLAGVLRIPETDLKADLRLADLGLSSLLALRLARQVEARSGVRLEARTILELQTVGHLVAHVAALLSEEPRPHAADGGETDDELGRLLARLRLGELSPLEALTATR